MTWLCSRGRGDGWETSPGRLWTPDSDFTIVNQAESGLEWLRHRI
jgi:hypothetical protein